MPGGFFTNVAGIPAGGFACWDGTNWSVPSGEIGTVCALRVDVEGLLVGGNFSLPGWTNPITLARWNGREWNVLNFEPDPCVLGGSCQSAVEQIAVVGTNIYVTMGDPYPTGARLLRSGQSNVWISVPLPDGSAMPQENFSISVFGDQLLAGGNFPGRNVAVYDGTDWQPVGGGFDCAVHSVAGNDRFACAAYRANGTNVPARYAVSRWDGTNWTQLGSELFAGDFLWRVILRPDETVYAVGPFSTVGDQPTPGLARWSGQHWEALLSGTYNGLVGYTGIAGCFAKHQGAVYMGGIFKAAGIMVTDGMARWTGGGWTDVGGGGTGLRPTRVSALLSSGAVLFAGGSFTNMGGSGAANIASWNGTNWSALGGGVAGNVLSLAWWRDSFYVGGQFVEAGGMPASNIARWTGNAWEPLGEGCDASVTSLVGWREKLYAGGRFTRAGNSSVSLIACWDGTSWQDVGGGLAGPDRTAVRRMAANEDGLYVVGRFTSAGGQAVTNIGRWDGTNWQAVGGALPGEPYALSLRGRTVFVGGRMTNEAGARFGGVYRLDGTNWISLGSGVSRFGLPTTLGALLATDDEVFVGGTFTRAGAKPSIGVARWIEDPRVVLDIRHAPPAPSLLLQATGDPGLRFDLEGSLDLSSWVKVGTGEDGLGEWNFDARGGPQRFFRALATP